jgi:glycosyltransferase involved in cell wall biosynthesis
MNAPPSQPLVSIVTPSYNQAAYLEDAIRSVLAQDYTPLEYLIVDGASQDGSLQIIQRYAGRLAWWVSEPDRGQAEAINKGFQHARGDIVAWLNSDDVYLPGAVRSAVDALRANPQAGMVYGEAVTIDSAGRPLNRLAFGDWELRELMNFRVICQPAVFMRRALLEKAGYLDDSFHYMLDHHLWLRMARLAPVVHVPQLWAADRHHPAAKNVAQAAGFGQETLRLVDWMWGQPDLAEHLRADRRHVLGGAYRLRARYLLDGGQPAAALLSYWKALWYWPSFAWRHKHRMAYALVRWLGGARLADRFARRASTSPGRWPQLSGLPGIQDWPGLNLAGAETSALPRES